MSQVLHREGPMPESLIACYAAQLLEVPNERTEGEKGGGGWKLGRFWKTWRGVDFFVFR